MVRGYLYTIFQNLSWLINKSSSGKQWDIPLVELLLFLTFLDASVCYKHFSLRHLCSPEASLLLLTGFLFQYSAWHRLGTFKFVACARWWSRCCKFVTLHWQTGQVLDCNCRVLTLHCAVRISQCLRCLTVMLRFDWWHLWGLDESQILC